MDYPLFYASLDKEIYRVKKPMVHRSSLFEFTLLLFARPRSFYPVFPLSPQYNVKCYAKHWGHFFLIKFK